jgi:AcrR family transcriptional regulator
VTIHTRRGRQKALVRQEIIDAARDILAREGYGQLSMRKVAERIEYSPTAIYLHFEDKRDLVFQVCEETFGRLVRELESLDVEFKDPVERLREGMRRYIAFGLRHPQHYLATFVAVPHDQGPEDVDRYNSPESNGMRALGILRACVVACSDAGKFRKVDPDVAARTLWAAMHGVTALLIQMPNFAWGDQQAVVDLLIDTSTEGLRLRRRGGER